MTVSLSNEAAFDQIQLRPDIEWIAQSNQSKWVARDPLCGSFFYFSEVEHTTAQLLGIHHACAPILKQLHLRFPGNNFTRSWLVAFIGRLNAAHLLSPTSASVVNSLTNASEKTAFQSAFKIFAAPLFLRLPLFNPSRLLNHFQWLGAIVFHPLTCAVVLATATVLAVLVFGRTLESDMLSLAEYSRLQGDRWLMLLASFVLVKSLHEIGHSLACSHFRVSCQEIGLLFLFFTPCLYCETTDSWKLKSRWHRAAIASAGMYVEIILASMAAAIWLTTREGTIHAVASSVMIVCSIGTLLINANPFLRYDGYYILSDVWGVPNLAEQSRDALRSLFVGALSGQKAESSHLDADILTLALFAIASSCYRMFLACMILWIAWVSLVPYGLGFVAVNIMFVYLIGLLFMITRISKSTYRDLVLRGPLRFSRLVLMFIGLIVLFAFVLEVPITTFVTARAVSDFSDKVPLFAPATSELTHFANPAQVIAGGELLVKFDAPEKRFAMEAISGEIKLVQEKLNQLETRSAIDETVAYEIPATRETIADLQAKKSLINAEFQSLIVKMETGGFLIAGDHQLDSPIASPPDDRVDLSPLATSNIGCTLQRGTLVGWSSPRQRPILTAVVSQEDVRLLNVGMEAACRWDSDLGSARVGTVSHISPEAITATPTNLLGDSTLISLRDVHGHMAPETPHYRVTIELQLDGAEHLAGSLASVRFKIASRTLFQSAVRFIQLTFKPVY